MAHYRGQHGCRVIATVGKQTARMDSWRGTGGRYKGAYVKDAGALNNPTSALKGLPPKVIAALFGEVSISVVDKPAADNGCEPGEPYQEVTLSYVTLEKTLNAKTGDVDGKPKRDGLDIGGFWIMKSTGEIERMRICTE